LRKKSENPNLYNVQNALKNEFISQDTRKKKQELDEEGPTMNLKVINSIMNEEYFRCKAKDDYS
jgi:hypothetical protein